MTRARRRLFVPVAALRAALAGDPAAGERLVYPEGTLLVGEHLEGPRVVETRGHIENNAVAHFQGTLRVGFRIED